MDFFKRILRNITVFRDDNCDWFANVTNPFHSNTIMFDRLLEAGNKWFRVRLCVFTGNNRFNSFHSECV